MNNTQQLAISALQSALATKRNITDTLQVTDNNGVITVMVNGAMVRIGNKGGYSLPQVSSYPESKLPGKTAFDAAIYADVLLNKQVTRRAAKLSAQPAENKALALSGALATV